MLYKTKLDIADVELEKLVKNTRKNHKMFELYFNCEKWKFFIHAFLG